MAFFLCSEPWGQIQGSCQVDWVKKLMEPCLLDIPSRAQMLQRMCASTHPEWIPHHIIQCIKCWSWGWALVFVILVARGDISAESEYSVYLGEPPAAWSCSVTVPRASCPCWESYQDDPRTLIEPDQPFCMKRDSSNLRLKLTRARWMTACRPVTNGASREVPTKSLPSVHGAALSWERLPPTL